MAITPNTSLPDFAVGPLEIRSSNPEISVPNELQAGVSLSNAIERDSLLGVAFSNGTNPAGPAELPVEEVNRPGPLLDADNFSI